MHAPDCVVANLGFCAASMKALHRLPIDHLSHLIIAVSHDARGCKLRHSYFAFTQSCMTEIVNVWYFWYTTNMDTIWQKGIFHRWPCFMEPFWEQSTMLQVLSGTWKHIYSGPATTVSNNFTVLFFAFMNIAYKAPLDNSHCHSNGYNIN